MPGNKDILFMRSEAQKRTMLGSESAEAVAAEEYNNALACVGFEYQSVMAFRKYYIVDTSDLVVLDFVIFKSLYKILR